MAAQLTDEERQAILDDIRAGNLGRNDIARKHKRSPGTITRIAEQAGLQGVAFDRTETERASRAKQADNRARRAALMAAYLDDAERIRQRLWQPSVQVGAQGQVTVMPLPGGRDARDLAMAGTALIKATIDVERHDQGDEGAEVARGLIGGIMAAIVEAAGEPAVEPSV